MNKEEHISAVDTPFHEEKDADFIEKAQSEPEDMETGSLGEEALALEKNVKDKEDVQSSFSVLVEKALKFLPWASLLVAVASAFIMDRSPKSAWMVVTAALLGWAAIIGFGLLSPLNPEHFTGKKKLLVKAAALLSLVVTQSLMQQCLFFSIPFYIGAMTFRMAHVSFVVALLVAAAITMWDPLYEKVMAKSGLRFILQSLAIFSGLNVVMPVMGLANSTSLFISALVAGIGIPLQGWVGIARVDLPSSGKVTGFWKKVQWDVFGASGDAIRLPARRGKAARTQLAATIAAAVFPIVIVNFSAPFIPPAPLRLVHAQLDPTYSREKQKQLESVEGVPAELNCMTWISAPRGVHEKLFHVWRRNGYVRDRIPLEIKGGNKGGYRTNSRKSRLGAKPKGKWTCSVETEAGQDLGVTALWVK